jgi:hypothetical protein
VIEEGHMTDSRPRTNGAEAENEWRHSPRAFRTPMSIFATVSTGTLYEAASDTAVKPASRSSVHPERRLHKAD